MSAGNPSSDNNRGLSPSTIKWILVGAVLLGIAIYLGIVLLNEDLRRDYFIQRQTTFVLIFGAVVVLFAVFKNVAQVQLPNVVENAVSPGVKGGVITLGGAAALFFILLGPVKDLMFPKDQIVDGNIYYKTNQQGEPLRPVPGVIVHVPESDQRSQPTSNEGRFTITNLSFRPASLNALYSDLTYPFDPAKYQHKRYDVIEPPRVRPPSQRTTLAATDWIESGNRCPNVNTADYSKVTLLVFQKSLPVQAGFENMMIKVNVENPFAIIDAQKERPDNEGYEDQLTEARTLTRQWSLPAKGNAADVKLTLCLGRKGAGPPPARNSLTTVYWFGH